MSAVFFAGVQRFVAYTGNNMQKKEPPVETKPTVCWDTANSYLSYVETVHRPAGSSRHQGQAPNTSSSSVRSKASMMGRRPAKTGSKASKK